MPKILIPLAQGCEELEAITLIDLLRRASFEVVTAGLDEHPVTSAGGVVLLPDTTLDKVMEEDFDLMVLPGGLPGSDHLDQDPRIGTLLKRLAGEGKLIGAICAAPKVLASNGLLQGKRATSYPGVLDVMAVPGVEVDLVPVVRDGQIVTGRGPGTAIDFALELIKALAGEEKRDSVEAALVR